MIVVIVVLPAALANTFSAQTIFPLVPESVYTYTESNQITRIETVLEPSVFNGFNVIGVIDNQGDTEYFTNDSEGVRSYGTSSTNGDTLILNPPARLLSGNIQLGQVTASSGEAVLTIDSDTLRLRYTTSSTIVDQETISVPAGTFDSIKVNSTITFTFQGSVISRGDSITWFAPNIGPIKDNTTIDGEADNDELFSFVIPGFDDQIEEIQVPMPLWQLLITALILCLIYLNNRLGYLKSVKSKNA